ncbi:MAG: hypothetical protein QME81_20300, partial [bacterium]|nr:hypothetical protein [bacterium]
MKQLSKESVKGAKYVDKLVRIYLKNGGEQWILVHIEVQGSAKKEFSLRMFRYFYRIFDTHGRRIVSIAILTALKKGAAKGKYKLKAYDSGVEFQYLSFRLMGYTITPQHLRCPRECYDC